MKWPVSIASVSGVLAALGILAGGTATAQTTTIYVSQSANGKLPVYTDAPVAEGSRQLIAMPNAPLRSATRTVGGRRSDYPGDGTRSLNPVSYEPLQYRDTDYARSDVYASPPRDKVIPSRDKASPPRDNIRRSALMPLITRTAQTLGVDHALLQALIDVESGFNPGARSPAGAMGLMQVMPATAARYGRFDLMVPAQNVEVGTRYLRDLLAMFKGDISLAVAAYNAGEYAVIKYGNRVPPFAETQRYVPMVLSRYRFYAMRGTN